MIGSYNVDNRSSFYNNEMAIFCKGSDSYTNDVKDNIHGRLNKSYMLRADGTAVDIDGNSVSIYGRDDTKKGKMKLLQVPASLIKFLL